MGLRGGLIDRTTVLQFYSFTGRNPLFCDTVILWYCFSSPSSRVIAAQVLLTTIDYTEYGEIARNNFHILEDLPHTEEIDSTEDDEERDPERLVSQLIRDSHDSRDWEWDDDLDDIVELWLDRERGGSVLRIRDIIHEDIGIDLISPPEPSDHEGEKYPE